MSTVYIAGPMRGYESFNFPAFMAAEGMLLNCGYDEVYNPARKDQEGGFDPTGMEGTMEELATANFDLAAAFTWDTEHVIKADHLVLLPGWVDSAGAKAEYALARAMGKEIFELIEIFDDFGLMWETFLVPLDGKVELLV